MAANLGNARLIVGISGASGAIYGARLLELLRPLPVETHLVMSRIAEVTLALETELKRSAAAEEVNSTIYKIMEELDDMPGVLR